MLSGAKKDMSETSTKLSNPAFLASLAKSYRQAVDVLEKMTGKKFKEINIVGGGCQNAMLNDLTAE